jgi:GNAT superfamily N-acetyltransferase
MAADLGRGIAPDDENVAAMIDAFGLMIGRLPRATADRSGGVASAFGHVPLAFFNMSILDRPMTDPVEFRAALDLACARARACFHSSFVGLCQAWAPDGADKIIADAGLSPALSVTGMAANRLLAARRPAPDLEYRLAGSPGVAEDLGLINALAYGMPPENFGCVAEPNLWRGQSFGVVGYVEGRAVSSTAAFVVGEEIYVAYVATLPAAYGRGYAEAVMRRAIVLAQDAIGPRRIWLHATEMGRPLYQSMGFEAGAALSLYALAS